MQSLEMYQMTDETAPEQNAHDPQAEFPGLTTPAFEGTREELVAEALGDHIFEWFLRNKRAEWRGYKTHISQYELNRYLRSL